MRYLVIAEFSNGRISEHLFGRKEDAIFCARNMEAGTFAKVTIYERGENCE